jgi:3-oxocholest-4-en-26-oate---CoA ligase
LSAWNYADVWEAVSETIPDWDVIVQGDRRTKWSELEAHANGVAHALLGAGLARQDKVALYLHNSAEYLEATFAAVKAALVPVNTNYRYRADELVYLWDDCDAAAVVFHGTFSTQIDEIRARVPRVKTWLWVDDGSGDCPEWADSYGAVAAARLDRPVLRWRRSPDDLLLLYTGGTTGMPKGVIWRQEDVFLFLNSYIGGYSADGTLEDVRRKAREGPHNIHLAPVPLMHASGGWNSYNQMASAGRVVLLPSGPFDAEQLLDLVDREQVNSILMVGEAFAGPILGALRAHPGRWRLGSLRRLASTGAALAVTTRSGLLEALPPEVQLTEGMSSSEAVSMGSSVAQRGEPESPAKFIKPAHVRVITDDDRDVTPGSGEIGRLAVGGIQPLGYYKDPEKTARTFHVIDGVRYVIPGDYAIVDVDGSFRFVGRGNVCINTGGEKVFPEEVENVITGHPAVSDAVVVGVPDPRFVEAVCALVSLHAGGELSERDLIAYVKSRISGYKAPKRVVFAESVPRLANGKLDYRAAKTAALRALSLG